MAESKNSKLITEGGTKNQAPNQTIILSVTKRGGLDVGSLMTGIKGAELIDNPQRVKLLDLYEDASIDTHWISVYRKHVASILSSQMQFQRGNKVDDNIQEQIDSPWFSKFLEDVIEDEWKGAGGTLFQFFRDTNGWLNYYKVPRKHLDPLNRQILSKQSDTTGTSWDNFSDLLYIGNPRSIGLMAAPAFWIILKRNDVGDWAQFAEIFGQPIREGVYPSFDEGARQKLINDILEMGGSAAYIHPEGTEINLKEAANKTGSVDVYEKLALFCNSEISKVVLGNTLTTEVQDKGTQALGEVQQEGEMDISFFVKRRLLNILNYEVTDLWSRLGFNTKGGKFSFVPPKAKNLSQKILIDAKLKEMGLPIGDDYLYETYDVPKPENYEELKKEMESKKAAAVLAPAADPEPNDDQDPEPTKSKASKKDDRKIENAIKNALKGFFGHAPKKGALDW